MNLFLKGSRASRLLALTIDDFPSSGAEDPEGGAVALLDTLRELRVPASLFCIGERVVAHPGLAARAVREGHELGNHMARDQWSIFLSKARFLEQLEATAAVIEADLANAGMPPVQLRWFRPGGGWLRPAMVAWAQRRGYQTVLGTIWPLDGLPLPLIPCRLRLALQQKWVLRLAHPGGIVVLHDTRAFNPLTLATLRQVVPVLKGRGFTFVTLSGLWQASADH